MIIFAHSKCKRYENRKIQGVALPKKERNGQEWKISFVNYDIAFKSRPKIRTIKFQK